MKRIIVFLVSCSIQAQYIGGNLFFTGSAARCSAYSKSGALKAFMPHNLGANTSLDPHIAVEGIHGDCYQWGQKIAAATTSTPAIFPGTWNTTPAPANAWLDGSKTVNDPCPIGFRVPTSDQWDCILLNTTVTRTAASWGASETNFASALTFWTNATTKLITLPASGSRLSSGGLSFRGSLGRYWSSSPTPLSSTSVNVLNFSSTAVSVLSLSRVSGINVRCIAE